MMMDKLAIYVCNNNNNVGFIQLKLNGFEYLNLVKLLP